MNRGVYVTTTGGKNTSQERNTVSFLQKVLINYILLRFPIASSSFSHITERVKSGLYKIIKPTTDHKQNMENEQYRDWRIVREKQREFCTYPLMSSDELGRSCQ